MSGAPSPPPDRSVELRQLEIAEERRRAQQEAQQAQRERQRFQGRVGSAFDLAQQQGANTLASRGLDEGEFLPIILQALQQARGTIPDLDPAPGNFFTGVADQALTSERDRRRAGFGRDISQFAPVGFAANRIQNTLDDEAINALIEEDITRANQEATNAQLRGSINDTGFAAALEEIGRQRSGVNARLQDIGGGVLETGRQDLRDIADRGNLGASSFELGQNFDPSGFKSQIDTSFTDFRNTLADRLRGRVGTDPLFDTSNLLNVAGAAQGAQNLVPSVGTTTPKPEDEDQRGLGSTGVF